MISKELNSADSRFARICSTALRKRHLFVKTEEGRSNFTRPPGEGPARFVDFATQSVPIEILD
jgi:hypothetical protein